MALKGKGEALEVVQRFLEDPRVLDTFKEESTCLMQGRVTLALDTAGAWA